MQTIEQTKTEYTKNPNTKTSYSVVSKEVETITEKQHHLTTCEDTVKWFRRFGGSETVTRNYTCAGYKVVKLISTSPNKQTKIVREFRFIDTSKPYAPKKENEFDVLEKEQRAYDDTLAERVYLENR